LVRRLVSSTCGAAALDEFEDGRKAAGDNSELINAFGFVDLP